MFRTKTCSALTIALAVLIPLLSVLKGQAQNRSPIQLDRPDLTESPSLVPTGYVQIENGFNYLQVNEEESVWTLPSTLWKYGVNENFELRMVTDVVIQENGTESTSGLELVTFGFKAKLCEEKGWIPKTSFIGHLTTSNLASLDFYSDYAAPSFRFVMNNGISERISIGYNVGAEWDGRSGRETYLYTLTSGIVLTDQFGMYLELFGYAPRDMKADHNFDGGFTYLLSNDIMLDLSAGTGLTENALDYYFSAGFSFRFATAPRFKDPTQGKN